MRGSLVIALLAAGCGGHAEPSDCELVLGKPANAMVAITARYPGDPVKVATTIEGCIAPSGELCDRLAKVIAAIPTMTPSLGLEALDVVKTCRDSPPDVQRCMLPSNILASPHVCGSAISLMKQTPIDSIPIQPSARPVATCAREFQIYVDTRGTWIATAADQRCYAPRKAGEIDAAWLDAEIGTYRSDSCATEADVAAAPTVAYRETIHAMDIVIKHGMDTGLDDPSSLAYGPMPIDPHGAPDHCAPPKDKPIPADAGRANDPTQTLPRNDAGLAEAPVVIVTKTELQLDHKSVATIAALRDGSGAIAELAAALPPSAKSSGVLILQGDELTDAAVINRIVATTKTAGFDNLLFAVKNK